MEDLPSLTASLSERSLSVAQHLTGLLSLSPGVPQSATANAKILSFLASKAQQFRSHADMLQLCLTHPTAESDITPQLKEVAARTLPPCDAAFQKVHGQVLSIASDDDVGKVKVAEVRRVEDFLVANSRVWILVMQLGSG
jgi:hypothetical protein